MVKSTFFRIVGLFALFAGAYSLWRGVLDLSNSVTVQAFLKAFIGLVIHVLAAYGGFRLVFLREIGRKLVVVWLAMQMLTVVLLGFAFVFSVASMQEFQVGTTTQISIPFSILYYFLCIVALIFLGSNPIIRDVSDQENHQLQNIATLLSVVTPGLGRALVGNPLIGILCFYLFSVLMTGTRISMVSYPEYMSWISQFLYYLVVWRVLSAIDWSAVKSFEESNQKRIDRVSEEFVGG